VLKTLKGRTALAAALLAAIGIALVTSLQSSLSERSMIASTVRQHEAYTARVAGEVDSRLRLARASLSEFAANIPGSQLRDAGTLHYYLTSRVGIQQAFESVAVYDTQGHIIASRPSIPTASIAQEDWFATSLRKAVVGHIARSRLSQEPVVPLTYCVYNETGQLRGVAVGTLPFNHGQLVGSGAHDAGRGHFVIVSRDGRIVLHPDAAKVGQPVDVLGPAAAIIRSGLAASAAPVVGPDSDGVRSLYAFHPISSTHWTLVGVVSNEEAYASLDRLSRQMLMAGALLALLLIPAMWVLVARMLLPLDELRRDMRRLKEGTDAGPEHKRHDATRELEQVAEEFASMAAARRVAEASLQQEKERAEVTLQSIGDAVLATDRAGLITAMNQAAERLTGWQLQDALGKPFGSVVILCNDTSAEPLPDLAAAAIRDGTIVSTQQTVLRTASGTSLPIDNSAAPIHSARGTIDGAVVVLRNVAKERAAAQELKWRATHDAMTGLTNRIAYENELKRMVETLEDGDDPHSVVMIDLDKFKIVNDTCGHAAGDELLKRLATMLQALTRKTDLVARLGGDEFAVLMYRCPGDNAVALAEKLRRAVADWRFEWEGKTFGVGASIGVVTVDRSFADAAAVQKAADMACYMAKRTGRNRVCVHSGDNQAVQEVRSQMQQVARIQSALDAGRLRLYGQPIRTLDEHEPHEQRVHVEVLLRMEGEDGKMVPPGDFLPAAERYGMMDQIDRWVIDHAIAACKARFAPADWEALDTVSVNLSPSTLRDSNIAEFIVDALRRHGMPPRCLCLEITETAMLENVGVARELLQGLRAAGVRIALDDFGVGTASLSQLRDLPVDVLKIDGSFIRGIHRDALNSEIVDAIQRIASRLNMQTVAECVEEAPELAHLRTLGVHHVQGYLLARPAPLSSLIGTGQAQIA
jgi:diguanylate cyclase (GGDEF)-like protein/PAS domain S-box-containing protein